ncbi:beta-lactamase-like protein [Boeremia exigua]|uniref:beta-lactamase-like protein n=1 Tax=Boeremia exigua TaxID=749465 RepID=UPI001E8D23AF|nr:beta-lactamase-like protein [Boeremia exigua]KAH6615206.1 beta-lactamase-like protein [Boeremia exigua]
MESPKPATDTIVEQQNQIRDSLPFSDTSDFDRAQYGLLGRREPNAVTNADGVTIWDNDKYNFLKEQEDAPPTVNPSLWRQSNLASIDGLFEVVEGIYQVRGLDLSNTTIIEGHEGLIVIDLLTSSETGEAAYQLYKQYRGDKPVKAIIYTHSHVDHFGGVKGFVSQAEVDSGAVRIFAPEGFLEHAVSENVYAGTAMARRAAYMYGAALDRNPQGQIGAGLGQTVSTGTITLIKPTDYISETGHTETVDGVKMVFQMAPGTEAPAEMLIYFPGFKALCAAEDATHTFHNILTLRGAVVRDPHVWARALTDAIDMFGGRAKVVFASHHWPTWGYDEVVNFLTLQRDLYAYVHDQTLRLINQGLNGPEIAEQMSLPPALDQAWNARGYYGSISHNVKAIYQRYMGWFDGNPAHLWEHIPVERAKRYVDLAGGMLKLIEAGRSAFKAGDFRWAAEVLNHAVFASPSNSVARGLLADVYEQLGYGAENGPWRNFFISGTTELRGPNFGTPTQTASADIIAQLTPEMLFDSFAIQINGPKAWEQQLSIKVVLTDGPRYRLWLSNAALVYTQVGEGADADVTLTTTTGNLPAIVKGFDPQALAEAGIDVEGDATALDRLAALLEPGNKAFNIIEP